LREFFIETKKGFINKRADKEIASYKEKSANAKAAASARWHKNQSDSINAAAMRTHSKRNANQEPRTKNHKPINQQQHNKHITIAEWAIGDRGKIIRQIKYNHDIPDLFCQSLEHEFIDYWKDQSADNWDSRFTDRCIERWSSYVGESWRKRYDSG
jgi:hypothetical protein